MPNGQVILSADEQVLVLPTLIWCSTALMIMSTSDVSLCTSMPLQSILRLTSITGVIIHQLLCAYLAARRVVVGILNAQAVASIMPAMTQAKSTIQVLLRLPYFPIYQVVGICLRSYVTA